MNSITMLARRQIYNCVEQMCNLSIPEQRREALGVIVEKLCAGETLTTEFYLLSKKHRTGLLEVQGFQVDQYRIWSHPDGRRAGQGTLMLLCDEAFCRYVGEEMDDVQT